MQILLLHYILVIHFVRLHIVHDETESILICI